MITEHWTMKENETREALQERAIEDIEDRGRWHGHLVWTDAGLSIATGRTVEAVEREHHIARDRDLEDMELDILEREFR